MATPVLNLGIYTPEELANIMTLAKAEYLRVLSGRITQGSSAAQSYGLTVMSVEDLVRLLNALGEQLGLDATEDRIRPNFNRHGSVGPWGYGRS